jgi:hypothetical protein
MLKPYSLSARIIGLMLQTNEAFADTTKANEQTNRAFVFTFTPNVITFAPKAIAFVRHVRADA